MFLIVEQVTNADINLPPKKLCPNGCVAIIEVPIAVWFSFPSLNLLSLGSWEHIWKHKKPDIVILAVGSMVEMVIKGATELDENFDCSIDLINCRFIKPLDLKKLKSILNDRSNIITIEEGSLIGGFGSAVSDYFIDYDKKIVSMGISDTYIEHGSRKELLNEIGLDIKGLMNVIREVVDGR